MDFRKIKLGVVESPTDFRDYRVSKIAKVTLEHEKEYETNWLPPVYDQGLVGSCVAFASRTLLEMQQYAEHGRYQPLSSPFIYTNRLEEHFQGEGMIPREALSQLKKDGVCREFMFSRNAFYKHLKGKLTDEMYRNAKTYKIEAYAKAQTVEEIMSAIKELKGILISVPIHDHFYDVKEKAEKKDTEIKGRHMMVIYGWKYIDGKLYWKVRNSWGTAWGNNGNILMADDYTNSKTFWAVTNKDDKEIRDKDYFITGKLGDKVLIDTEDGRKIKLDDEIPMINERIYLPLRAVAEAVGTEIHWDSRLKKFYILKK
ncbi:MAG: C1 family peptidase [Halanaerobiales bacterium]